MFSQLYGYEEERLIGTYLKSEMPSVFMNGLRMASEAARVMRGEPGAAVMDRLTRQALRQLPRMGRFPITASLVMHLIIRILRNSDFKSCRAGIFEALKPTMTAPSSSACFTAQLAWLPVAVSECPDACVDVTRAELFARSRSPGVFNLAVAVLKGRLRRLRADQRQAVLMDEVATFLGRDGGHRTYFTSRHFAALCRLARAFAPDSAPLLLDQMSKAVPPFQKLCAAELSSGAGAALPSLDDEAGADRGAPTAGENAVA